MNSPNMSPEILEAVHGYFEDLPEVEADCYLYLSDLNFEDCKILRIKASKELTRMDRCPYCGTLYEYNYYDEVHDELDGKPVEHICEPYCPNCDVPFGGE